MTSPDPGRGEGPRLAPKGVHDRHLLGSGHGAEPRQLEVEHRRHDSNSGTLRRHKQDSGRPSPLSRSAMARRSSRGSRSERLDIVQVEAAVGSEDRQSLELCLSDQQPVEGVAMPGRECGDV